MDWSLRRDRREASRYADTPNLDTARVLARELHDGPDGNGTGSGWLAADEAADMLEALVERILELEGLLARMRAGHE